MQSYMVPAITNPYYDLAPWMDKEIELNEIIKLSKESSKEDVQLFISTLFGFNSIDINRDFEAAIKELMDQPEVVISGGILFYNADKEIVPSCCCGLENWQEIINDIIKGESPWLGHDPYPTIEYLNHVIRVWSDDYIGKWNNEGKKDNESLYYIDYFTEDINEKTKQVEKDLHEFAFGPMKNWMMTKDKYLTERFIERFHEWFDVKGDGFK